MRCRSSRGKFREVTTSTSRSCEAQIDRFAFPPIPTIPLIMAVDVEERQGSFLRPFVRLGPGKVEPQGAGGMERPIGIAQEPPGEKDRIGLTGGDDLFG